MTLITLFFFLLGVIAWLARMTPLDAVLFMCSTIIPAVQSVDWLIGRRRPAESGTARMERGRTPRRTASGGSPPWRAVLREELREPNRILGGLLGLIFSGAFGFVVKPELTLQAEPIICCALFGAVFGCRYRRFHGLTIGAGLGLVVVFAAVEVATLAPLLESRWWVGACFVPLGGLFAGYISDGRLQSRYGTESASAATSGHGLRIPESAGPH